MGDGATVGVTLGFSVCCGIAVGADEVGVDVGASVCVALMMGKRAG